MTIELTVLIGIVSAILGMIFGYANFYRQGKKEVQVESINAGELKSDIKYIMAGVDEVKRELKDHTKQMHELEKKVTEIESSVKSAHKRIDGLTKAC